MVCTERDLLFTVKIYPGRIAKCVVLGFGYGVGPVTSVTSDLQLRYPTLPHSSSAPRRTTASIKPGATAVLCSELELQGFGNCTNMAGGEGGAYG